MLWGSVVEKCCEGVLWGSVVWRSVVKECCGEVLWSSVVEKVL